MSDYICPYTCSYRTNSGFCGHTGGWERCQYRQLRQPNTVVGYVPSLIKTNSDRIRAMTDEELAEWIADDLIEPGYNTREQTVKIWLDWLKQEVSDEGT